jgi:Xaa-Pro aminopeptidase
MVRLTAEKLAQAARLTAASGADVWITFVRETAEGGDPVLPLLLGGGLVWQSALLVSATGRKVAVVGNYDADPLRASGDWDEVVPYVQGIRGELLAALERLVPDSSRPPRLAVNWSLDDPKADGLTHGMYLQLLDLLRGSRFENRLVSAEAIASDLRSRKTRREVERIREAVRFTHEIFAEIGGHIAVGRTEREMFDFAQERIRARGLGFAWDATGDPIVNTGPDSMVGHGVPSETIRVAPGHVVHFDLGVLWQGYASDLQRCWYVAEDGEALPEDVTRAFRAVHGAITEGSRALRPGVPGWQVDEAARSFVVAAGYPEYLHALGHQVGRMAHDGGGVLAPRWERYGRMPELPVQADQVFTLELGVMVEGRGYLGLEEMVRVTEDGCLWLSERQDELPTLRSGRPPA